MNRTSNLIAIAALFSVSAVAAAGEDDSPRQSNYSTVKLLFIDHQPSTDIGMMGGKDSQKTAKAGSLVLPASAFRPAKVYLDDEFVSDAMFGFVDAKPTFNISSGVHSFRIECEGYKPFKSEIKVLAGGCEQWLVVVMRPEEEPLAAEEAKASGQSAASR